jgi:hypothetical protein
MLNEAYQFIFTAPLALVFPGLPIMLCVLSFNVVADGLRDAIGRGSTVERPAGIRTRMRAGRAARADGAAPVTGPDRSDGARPVRPSTDPGSRR